MNYDHAKYTDKDADRWLELARAMTYHSKFRIYFYYHQEERNDIVDEVWWNCKKYNVPQYYGYVFNVMRCVISQQVVRENSLKRTMDRGKVPLEFALYKLSKEPSAQDNVEFKELFDHISKASELQFRMAVMLYEGYLIKDFTEKEGLTRHNSRTIHKRLKETINNYNKVKV